MMKKFEDVGLLIQAYKHIKYRVELCRESLSYYTEKKKKFFFFEKEVFDRDRFEANFSDICPQYLYFIFYDNVTKPTIYTSNEYDDLRSIILSYKEGEELYLGYHLTDVANDAIKFLENHDWWS